MNLLIDAIPDPEDSYIGIGYHYIKDPVKLYILEDGSSIIILDYGVSYVYDYDETEDFICCEIDNVKFHWSL